MKKTILVLFVLLIGTFSLHSQNIDTKIKSRAEVNLFLMGIGANYEYALFDEISIQARANYGFYFLINSENVNYISTMSFGIEPRYYYNLKRRNRKGKNTFSNAANFISLDLTYYPDLLTNSNTKKPVTINSQSSISPMWNIRRNIRNSNFNYEFGIGLNFTTVYYEYIENEKDIMPALNLKIGYSF